jgi:hypothetical protein
MLRPEFRPCSAQGALWNRIYTQAETFRGAPLHASPRANPRPGPPAACQCTARRYRRVKRWQFWVFDVLPVLMAIGISVEVFYLAQQREIQVGQAEEDEFNLKFQFTAH